MIDFFSPLDNDFMRYFGIFAGYARAKRAEGQKD